MNQQGNGGFTINDWQVSPQEGMLSRNGQTVRLEPKAMEVLAYLAARPGEVITREQLEQDVWHGAVVGYDAVTNTVIKLRKALQDSARDPHFIATIPKKGYQLIADVVYSDAGRARISRDPSAPSAAAPSTTHPRWLSYKLGLAAGLLGLLLLMSLVWPESEPSGTLQADSAVDPGASLPSIVVLPFEYQTGDTKQENIANGMMEDIITDLSKFSSLLVFSSNTSNEFKGRQVSPQEIGTELKAGFVLKGSIRRLEQDLRVNAQLINTSTGFNIWAERYDRKVSEIFAVQDELAQSIVKALTSKLTAQEKERLAHRSTDNLKAYDLFQEGRRLAKLFTREANVQAREMFRQAIELDPGYGRAYGASAVSLAYAIQRGWPASSSEALDRALELARKGVALDKSAPQTYWALGFIHLWRKEYKQAEEAARESLKVAPNYGDGHGLLALIKAYTGQAREAIEINDKATRLNPYYSSEYLLVYGVAYYRLGEYEKAASTLQTALSRNANSLHVQVWLIASLVRIGKYDEAEWLAEEIQVTNPQIGIASIEKIIPFFDETHKQALLGDLRKAGLPEG